MNAATVISKKKRTINLTDITSGSLGSPYTAYEPSIHPNGNFIALSSPVSSKQISVWSWNGSSAVAEVETIDLGQTSGRCHWHPNGNYLAVGCGSDTGTVQVYSWNGTDTLTQVETLNGYTAGEYVRWHPNGNYLALACDNTSKEITIFSWNGTDTLTEVETVNLGSYGFSVQWSADGNYLSASYYGTSIYVYSWNGTDTLTQVATYDHGSGYTCNTAWTPDGVYLFAFNVISAKTVTVFEFDGSSLTLRDTINIGTGSTWGCAYKNKYVAFTVGKVVYLYSFNTSTKSFTSVDSITYSSSTSVSYEVFNSNGTYLAVSMNAESGVSLRMVKVYV